MPDLVPKSWFLAENDLPQGRTPAFTSGNFVQPLVDGASYMRHLDQRLRAMDLGDFLHLAAWRVTSNQSLTPSDKGFVSLLQNRISAGVTVRALLWEGPPRLLSWLDSHRRDNHAFASAINLAGGLAVLDGRLPGGVLSSHHQKCLVLSSAETIWGYVGGIDLCKDRWDTTAHDSPPGRDQVKYDGWHDLHAAVRGPAVAQLWDNFTQRWNDRTRPTSGRSRCSLPPPILLPPPIAAPIGTHYVQVLRTLPCKQPYYPFLPEGEQTIQRALQKAIDLAEHFVYLEDQYLWPGHIVSALSRARERGVKIVMVLNRHFDLLALSAYHNHLRATSLRSILGGLAAGPDSGVYPFHLEQAYGHHDIYVHSKVVIIDDRYAAFGSANINRRSATTDTELHLAVIDAELVRGTMGSQPWEACCFARALRMTLWREHLGLADTKSLEDPINSLAEWPSWSHSTRAAPRKRHHAVCHFVPVPRLSPPIILLDRLLDPNISC